MVHQQLVTVFLLHVWVLGAVELLRDGIGGVAVGIRNEELVESPILGTAEEGALFSLTTEGGIKVNNPHKSWS